MPVQTTSFATVGGENLAAGASELRPGELLFSRNYEATLDGHPRRVQGFERYDGRTLPSTAAYSVLEFENGTAEPVNSDTITGATSGDTATVLGHVVDTGTFVDGTARGRVILFDQTGAFEAGESVAFADVVASATQNWSDTDANFYAWNALAVEAARGEVARVPGFGVVRGVWVFNGDKYVFRDDPGSSQGRMYKATSQGWELQDLGASIEFGTGAEPILKGETVTGAVSGATGVVVETVVESGDWGTNDAAGVLYLKDISGAFQAEGIASATGAAACLGAQTVNALPEGGYYRFYNTNFFGGAETDAMYGVNGVGMAFQWDGTGFAFIATGADVDTPTFVIAHQKHLFLGYPGGGFQHSGIGSPMEWSAVSGAATYGIGQEITGWAKVPGGILAVFGAETIELLYGTSAADFQLKTHAEKTGAVLNTIQQIDGPLFLSANGFASLEATDRYGDFQVGTFSKKIQPLISELHGDAISSTVSRRKNQYRVFRETGNGLSITFTREGPSFFRFSLGIPVRCVVSADEGGGEEEIYFGSDDGYVYKLDSGNSFDGETVEAFLRFAFYHYKSPGSLKRFRSLDMEVRAPGAVAAQVLPDFSYGDDYMPPGQEQAVGVQQSGGYWGTVNWENFVWSGPAVSRANARIDGSGTNLSLYIRTESVYEPPHTIEAMHVHHSRRRRTR